MYCIYFFLYKYFSTKHTKTALKISHFLTPLFFFQTQFFFLYETIYTREHVQDLRPSKTDNRLPSADDRTRLNPETSRFSFVVCWCLLVTCCFFLSFFHPSKQACVDRNEMNQIRERERERDFITVFHLCIIVVSNLEASDGCIGGLLRYSVRKKLRHGRGGTLGNF